MIITDLMELLGKKIRVYCQDGRIEEGILGYIRSYSEEFEFKKPHYFFVNDFYFKAYQIEKVELI